MTTIRISSDQKEVAEMIRSAISAEVKRLEIGLKKTEKEIKAFEDKYKVSSEVFLARFGAEDLHGGDEEYVRWEGELKVRQRILEDLKRLEEIEYVSG
ncbi:MAG: hypothetical protein AB1638_13165 [Nitrospirota bacterium]